MTGERGVRRHSGKRECKDAQGRGSERTLREGGVRGRSGREREERRAREKLRDRHFKGRK